MARIRAGASLAAAALSPTGGDDAAHAILTTDTVDKQVAVRLEIDGCDVTVGGMCKGSGMIEPMMATLLGFVTTDAAIGARALDAVREADLGDEVVLAAAYASAVRAAATLDPDIGACVRRIEATLAGFDRSNAAMAVSDVKDEAA
jgi:hypothetical protein